MVKIFKYYKLTHVHEIEEVFRLIIIVPYRLRGLYSIYD